MRIAISREQDPPAKLLMVSMYRDLYGHALREADAERPMMIMRKFIRSSLVYVLFALAVISILGYIFGRDVIYVGGFLLLEA
jgi:hypothetical protein